MLLDLPSDRTVLHDTLTGASDRQMHCDFRCLWRPVRQSELLAVRQLCTLCFGMVILPVSTVPTIAST
eukprot:2634702-Amphidinium_carterae.1